MNILAPQHSRPKFERNKPRFKFTEATASTIYKNMSPQALRRTGRLRFTLALE
jgi:hypothetical protein